LLLRSAITELKDQFSK